MKTILISLLVVTAGAVRAQQGGTVVFGNNNSSKLTISQTGQPVKASDNVQVALYWAPIASSSFVQIGAPANVGVLNVQTQAVPLDGIFAGGTRTTGAESHGGTLAQFQVRAWSGNYTNYEQAAMNVGVMLGQSTIIQSLTSDPTGAPPAPPGALVGLQGFALAPNASSTRLTITPSGPRVIISWPSPSSGFGLQENPDLNPANWSAVPPTNSDNGTIKSIMVPAGPGNRFYRLKK